MLDSHELIYLLIINMVIQLLEYAIPTPAPAAAPAPSKSPRLTHYPTTNTLSNV